MDCEFKLLLQATGKISLECTTLLTKEFAHIASKQMDDSYIEISKASLYGKTDNGGTIEISEVVLDITSLSGYKLERRVNGAERNYVVHIDSVDELTRNFISRSLEKLGASPNTSVHGSWVFKCQMSLKVIREVAVRFFDICKDDVLTSLWGLTNMEFAGCEASIIGRTYNDNFSVSANGFRFKFYHIDNYKQKIEQLNLSGGVNVTAEVITAIKYSELTNAESTLDRLCILLTMASLNWVTPMYKDILKDGKTMESYIFPHKTFSFVKADYVIDSTSRNPCQTRAFLELAIKKYWELEGDFGLRFVIEYYISAVRQLNSEDKFIIGFVALECLASYVPDYAKKFGDTLETNAVANNEKRIKGILSKFNTDLSPQIIHALADALTYKHVGIKARMRYLLSKFDVKIDDGLLNSVVNLRGVLFHTGIDKERLASEQYRNLFSIIERTLLIMLGWRGHEYINKIAGYRRMTLE